MSSPADSTGGGIPGPSDGGSHKKPLEQIAFRFCGECSNMLYPREDVMAHKLMFTCRTCQYSEPAQTSCIYRNVLNNAVGETAGVTQDVASDPTLPRSNKPCPSPKCDGQEAVFFQSQQRSAETGMKLFFVCCTCGNIFH